MAMQCSRCDYLHKTATKCPKCGAPMRLTFLGESQAKERANTDTLVRIEEEGGPPSFGKRVAHFLAGMGIFHLLVYGLAAAAYYYWILGRRLNREEFFAANPLVLPSIEVGLPLLAVAVAVLYVYREVYLAHLAGLVLGATATFAFLIERQFLPGLLIDVRPVWWEWPLMPTLGAGIGFYCGLKVAGVLKVKGKQIEYKTLGVWNKKSKPKYRELEPSLRVRRMRLLLGIAGSFVFFYLFKWLAGPLLGVLATMRGARLSSYLNANQQWIMAAAVFMGGFIAGTRTKSGVVQGLLTAGGIFGAWYYFDPPQDVLFDVVLRLVAFLAAGILGGVAGRHLFGPVKVYSGGTEAGDVSKDV